MHLLCKNKKLTDCQRLLLERLFFNDRVGFNFRAEWVTTLLFSIGRSIEKRAEFAKKVVPELLKVGLASIEAKHETIVALAEDPDYGVDFVDLLQEILLGSVINVEVIDMGKLRLAAQQVARFKALTEPVSYPSLSSYVRKYATEALGDMRQWAAEEDRRTELPYDVTRLFKKRLCDGRLSQMTRPLQRFAIKPRKKLEARMVRSRGFKYIKKQAVDVERSCLDSRYKALATLLCLIFAIAAFALAGSVPVGIALPLCIVLAAGAVIVAHDTHYFFYGSKSSISSILNERARTVEENQTIVFDVTRVRRVKLIKPIGDCGRNEKIESFACCSPTLNQEDDLGTPMAARTDYTEMQVSQRKTKQKTRGVADPNRVLPLQPEQRPGLIRWEVDGEEITTESPHVYPQRRKNSKIPFFSYFNPDHPGLKDLNEEESRTFLRIAQGGHVGTEGSCIKPRYHPENSKNPLMYCRRLLSEVEKETKETKDSTNSKKEKGPVEKKRDFETWQWFLVASTIKSRGSTARVASEGILSKHASDGEKPAILEKFIAVVDATPRLH